MAREADQQEEAANSLGASACSRALAWPCALEGARGASSSVYQDWNFGRRCRIRTWPLRRALGSGMGGTAVEETERNRGKMACATP